MLEWTSNQMLFEWSAGEENARVFKENVYADPLDTNTISRKINIRPHSIINIISIKC